MAMKIISNKFGKKEGAQTDTSHPAICSDTPDADASRKSGKKFNPRWGKPVIVRSPAAAKKPGPVVTSSVTPPLPLKKEGETAKVDVIIPEVDRPALANFSAMESNLHVAKVEPVSANAPVHEPPLHPAPSLSGSNYSNVLQPVEAKKSTSRMRVWMAVSAVILICIALGYIYFPKPKSAQVAEHAVPSSPQEAVVTAPAVAEKNQAPVPAKPEVTKVSHEENVRNLVKTWLTNWQSGNVEAYRSCYAPDFQAKGKNLEAWIAYKTNVFKKSKNINITIDNLQITADENNAKAVFTQHYSSSITKDSGQKTLELKQINNEWKIYKEMM
ncbi:MAG: nuclear transport factor 2 family protein [Smithella sp.]